MPLSYIQAEDLKILSALIPHSRSVGLLRWPAATLSQHARPQQQAGLSLTPVLSLFPRTQPSLVWWLKPADFLYCPSLIPHTQ